MAHILADMVKQTSVAWGDTAVPLTGAALSPYRPFSSVLSNGDTTEATVVDRGTGSWQAAVYAFNDDVLTLVPEHFFASSTGSPIDFALGIKDVSITPLAEMGKTFLRTADFNALPHSYDVDTRGGEVTALLPAAPVEGERYFFNDFAGAWPTHPFTVDPNGGEFESLGDESDPTEPKVFDEATLIGLIFSAGKYRVRTNLSNPAVTWLPAGSHFTIGQPTNGFGDPVAPFAQFGGYGGNSNPNWFGRGPQIDFPAQIYLDTTVAPVHEDFGLPTINSAYLSNWGESNVAFTVPTVVRRAAMLKVNPVGAGTNATIINSFAISTNGMNLFDGLNALGSVTPEAKAHVGGNVDIAAWSTIGRNFVIDGNVINDNTTTEGTTITSRAVSSIGAATLGFTLGPATITHAYSLLFNGPPLAGTNATITFPWALGVRGGANSRFGSSLNPLATDMRYVTVITDSGGSVEGQETRPNGFLVHDVNAGGAWDTVNPWGVLDFSSDDLTELDHGIRARIGVIMEDVEGRRARVAISTAPVESGVLVDRLTVTARGNILTGNAALATDATDGSFYLTTSAGEPTGVPTAYEGVNALRYDRTNKLLWIYDEVDGWLSDTDRSGIVPDTSDAPAWVRRAVIGNAMKAARLHIKFDSQQYWCDEETTFGDLINYTAADPQLYQDDDGAFLYSEVDTPVLTSRGMLFWRSAQTSVRYNRDLRINYRLTLSGFTQPGEFFTDGEAVTASGGGSGIYIDTGESAGNAICLGNWTGTAPATSQTITGANAVVTVGTATAIWVHSNVTVAKDQVGLDGVANACCRVTATAANAYVKQAVTISSQERAMSSFMRRLVGTGEISVTVDGGSTWEPRAVTSDLFGRYCSDRQTMANQSPGIRIVTSGDSVVVDLASIPGPGVEQEDAMQPGQVGGLGLADMPAPVPANSPITVGPNQCWLKRSLGSLVNDITRFTVFCKFTPTVNTGGNVLNFDFDGTEDYVAIQNYSRFGTASNGNDGVTYETPANLGGFGNDPVGPKATPNLPHSVAWAMNANDVGSGKGLVMIAADGSDAELNTNHDVAHLPQNLHYIRVGMQWKTNSLNAGFPGQGHMRGYVTEFAIFDGVPTAGELAAMAPGSQELP